MSSFTVVGIVEPDDQFRKMKAVLEACHDAGIDVPDEVDEYFMDYVSKDKESKELPLEEHYDCFTENMVDGVTIELADLRVVSKRSR